MTVNLLDKLIDRIADRVVEKQHAGSRTRAAELTAHEIEILRDIRHDLSKIREVSAVFGSSQAPSYVARLAATGHAKSKAQR